MHYRVIHPLVRQVLKMRIWGVPLAGGLLLWLITALAGPRNLSKNLHQNIANEWMNNAVLYHNQVNNVKGCVNLAPPFPGFIFPPLLDVDELEARVGITILQRFQELHADVQIHNYNLFMRNKK